MEMCQSLINSLPVISMLSLFAWSYYTYVFELCLYIVNDLTKQIPYLIIFHILFALTLWSYFKVMCTDIAVVPNEFKVPSDLYERIKAAETDQQKNQLLSEFTRVRNLSIVTRIGNGYIRFCNRCKQVKPDRAHHCTTCGTCVLKMDHHCPWVNNCIGFSNQKFFLLFLLYAAVYCIFYFGTSMGYGLELWYCMKNYSNLHVIIGMCIAVAMSVLGFAFFLYNFNFVLKNLTTLETLRPTSFRSNDITFDLGTYENFVEVFGDNFLLWLFPINTTYGDGIVYPFRFIV